MGQYLVVYNGVGAKITFPRESTSDYFGEVTEDFARQAARNPDPDWPYATLYRLYPDQCSPQGIFFEWGLAGPDGAYYTLLRMPGDTQEQIRGTKHWLRGKFDVVTIRTVTVTRLVDYRLPQLVLD